MESGPAGSRKGTIMAENLASKKIEQLLVEAEELNRQINTDAIKDLQGEPRLHLNNMLKTYKKSEG
jgi:hypothetical protein